MADSPSSTILRETRALREQLLAHPLYQRVNDLDSVRVFMQHHVFAVWDFMSLLKRLQRDLCCCDVLWLPPKHGNLARFINEIVLGEESDESQDHETHVSHFDLYRDAMADVSSNGTAIDGFVGQLRSGSDIEVALESVSTPDFVRQFVQFNCGLAADGQTHEVASAFCFGREDIIPDMFERLLAAITNSTSEFPAFRYYVERHIELDGDHHGPLSRQLIDVVVGDCPERLAAALKSATDAIQHRIALWDGILLALPSAMTVEAQKSLAS